MGRKRCIRAFARIAVTVALVAVVFLILGEYRPARADWTKFTANSPWCQGTSGCPTLEASCENAADYMSGFNGSAPDDAAAIQTLNYYQAQCLVYNLPPYGTTWAATQNSCPSGTQMLWSDTGCVPYTTNPKKDCGPDCDPGVRNGPGAANVVPDTVGNPIDPGSARKFERVVDFTTGGPNALAFIRYYDTMYTDYALSATNKYALGFVWHSNFHSPKVYLMPGTSNLYVVERAGGQLLLFQWINSAWTPDRDIPAKLAGSSSAGWTFTDWNDQVTTYGTSGRLLSIRERNGYLQTLAYDANGRLTTVTDSYGRQLSFSYSAAGLLATMTAPGGAVYRYAYDAAYVTGNPYYADRLVRVTYPDDTPADSTDNPKVNYTYGIPGYRYVLTGITDEKGNQFASFGYDSLGRATSSEHAGGVDRATVAYPAGAVLPVTNPLDQQYSYTFAFVTYPPVGGASYGGFSGMSKLTRMDRTANATIPAASASWIYDGNGYIASHTDWNGNLTAWVRNTQGLETSRTEAAGTPQARTITTTWHASFRVPTQIVEPGKTTDFTYDTSGRVLTKTETDTRTQTVPYSTNGQTRTWTYTWDATGLLQTVNGPRTDVTDVTTYAWTNGVLSSVTNALGQATTINAVNERGLPTQVTDANGVVTDLAYNQRGWLTSVTKRSAGGDATTSFAYDAAGLLTRMTLPDGSYLDYTYDAAHRLTAITNNFGERIEYALDAMGNRTAETIKTAAGGTITKTMTRAYDQLGRLLQSIGATNQTTVYAYDHEGNVVSLTDPLSGVTAQAYDALDRLISSTDPATKVTAYGYDDQDDLISVTDARNVQTTYVYDGFGRVIQTASPDGGTTVYHYDPADNLTQKTDGRAVVTNYTYDALNRITAKTFPAATAENVTYAYDDSAPGHYGIGRLASITDESGSTAFVYDSRGNVVQETRTIAGTAYVTGYAYDVADRLIQMTYPSGRILSYARDTLGRVTSVTTQASAAAAPATIAADITYKPFGPIASMLYGNGLARTYTYDSDYRLTGLVTGDADTFVQNLTYGYDAADNITSIADAIESGRSQTFTYDSLFRLKTAAATGTYGSITYNYDDVGNRTSVVDGGGTESYSTDTSSNRLLSVTLGSTTRSFTYDGAGNIITDNAGGAAYGLAYNKANRLAEVSLNGTPDTDYVYNALGERVKKAPAATPAAGSRFHYDRDGKLIAETDSTGAVIREYAWLDGLPIGEFTNASAGTAPGQVQVDNGDAGASFTGSWTTATAGSGYVGSDYHKYEPSSGSAPASGTTIDNTSAQFKTTGIWTTATTPSGFEGTNFLTRTSSDGLGSDVFVDNGGTGFSTTGTWPTTTYCCYYGSNYAYHVTNDVSPDSVIVDNGGTGFSTTDTWSTTAYCCYYGTNYAYHKTNQPTPDSIIDNGTAATSKTGTWSVYTTTSQKIGANLEYKLTPDGTSTYTWTPSLPAAGQYRVYAYWYAWSGNATNAPYTIYYDGGSTTVQVNQRVNGGIWNPLGTFAMTPGQNHRIVLTAQGDGQVIADAVAVTPVDAANRAIWTPTLSSTRTYNVYARWHATSDRATNATFTVYHAGGATPVQVNQQLNNNKWVLLGSFTMGPGQNHRVELGDIGTNTYVVADAIAFSPADLPNRAIWTPALSQRDEYDVYGWWHATSDRATNAPYTIFREGGTTAATVNQQLNNATWTLLGTVTLAPGQNHRVELSDLANNTYVVADAVRFAPKNAAKTATWPITVATTGSYKVYAKWPASSAHATDAQFTVTHAGGTSTITANQRLNGGQWNLLGSFTFNSGTGGYGVTLADNPLAKVAADAIYVVPDTAPAVAFTWTPTLPSAGAYQVYARWPASSANTGAAQYTVTRDGGTSTVTLNQKQNGGAWVLLGSYNFTPAAGQKVTLAPSSDGTTIADAMLFVGAGAQPANLLYVHADHLGSPQKMTNPSQAIAWDGVFDPFGEEVAITGLAAMPMRFPGQYADDETGYSYNYFRDYDPALGR